MRHRIVAIALGLALTAQAAVAVAAAGRSPAHPALPAGPVLAAPTVWEAPNEVAVPRGVPARRRSARPARRAPRPTVPIAAAAAPQPAPVPAPVDVAPPSAPPPAHTVADLLGPSPGGAPRVALTFDDGPSATYTPAVLDLLAARGVRATFFVIGAEAAARPELVARMRAEGHTVANHSWDHLHLTGMPRHQVAEQLDRVAQLLQPLDGEVTCFRPPYGEHDDQVRRLAADRGMRTVNWTTDGLDWAEPGATSIAADILGSVHPDAIVLLHDGGGDQSQTLAALPLILDGLAARGYEVVPIC